jgi:hypothetical protein
MNNAAASALFVLTYGPSHAVFGQRVATLPTKAVAVREAKKMARAYDAPAVITRNGVFVAGFRRKAPWS